MDANAVYPSEAFMDAFNPSMDIFFSVSSDTLMTPFD